jgi:putative SOS response-associated peptidase YedK
MCGRFSLGASATKLAELFDLTEVPNWAPRYNIAPTQELLVVVKAPEHPDRQVRRHRWGLIPSWAKDRGIGNQLINAQAETVPTKPAFRAAFRKRRCLVPADGFYEWTQQGGQKQPYYIRLRDGGPFAIAGLWEHWEGQEGGPVDSCTLLTTSANDLIGAFHHRMPVILNPTNYDLWLDAAVQEAGRLQALLQPYPSENMVAYPVRTMVNNPANDDPGCIEPERK